MKKKKKKYINLWLEGVWILLQGASLCLPLRISGHNKNSFHELRRYKDEYAGENTTPLLSAPIFYTKRKKLCELKVVCVRDKPCVSQLGQSANVDTFNTLYLSRTSMVVMWRGMCVCIDRFDPLRMKIYV
jgi:hypothetical protein